VHRDVERPPAGVDEQLGRALPLVDTEQDPLARRAEREQAVEPAGCEELAQRRDRVLVQRSAAVAQRRGSSGQGPAQHDSNLRFAAMNALRAEQDGHVLRVTLARPEVRNAFDAELIAELHETFADVGDARVVVLAGEGESFCAGADVEWQRASIELTYEENVIDARKLRQMLEAVDRCRAPVIARVHGHAFGGGCGLIACADIAVAADGTVFAFSEVKLGIVPAVISPFALAKIGPSAARRYFVTGERFDAQTALRIGLVHEVATDVDAALERILGELATAGPEAIRSAKRLALERPDGLATDRWAAERRTSDEGQEGLRAFLEKRKASWAE
jgi:methylglutaconyl-CoA hydratase